MKHRGWLIFLVLAAGAGSAFVWVLGAQPFPAAAGAAAVPTIAGVEPNTAMNDLDTDIVITGAGFMAGISGTVVITQPVVHLGSTTLAGARWVNSTTITATVPWGLNPAVYPLSVTNPGGGMGDLTEAFTVTRGIGVWVSGGPYGGASFKIVINPTTPTTLYANSAIGTGLFRSRDSGDTWQMIFADLGYGSSIALDPFQPQTLYLGTGKFGTGLYRSDDEGETWTAIPIPGENFQGFPGIQIFPHPTIPGTIFVAIHQPGVSDLPYVGLYRSTDRGAHWEAWNHNLADREVTSLAFHPLNPQIMYLGTANGNVFKSTDGGLSWQTAGKPVGWVTSVVFNPFHPDEVWLTSSMEGIFGTMWKYTSGSWTEILPGTGYENAVNKIDFSATISGTMWIATGYGSFISVNGGSIWVKKGAFPDQPVRTLSVNPVDPAIVYESYARGFFRTEDNGDHWQERKQGFAGIIASGLAVRSGHPETVYAVTNAGLFKSDSGGNAWIELPLDISGGGVYGGSLAVDPFIPERVYLGYWGGMTNGVRISENGGFTWRNIIIPLPARYQSCCLMEVKSIIAPPGQAGHLVMGVNFANVHVNLGTGYGGFFTSGDYGETWTFVELGSEIDPVVTLAFDPLHPQTVYAGTRGQYDSNLGTNTGDILKSLDGGLTWQSIGQSLGGDINAIAVEPGPAGRVFLVYWGIRYSSDGGASWHTGTNPITQGFIHQLLFVSGSPPVLYAATTEGLFRSYDGAQTWERAAGAMGSANIQCLAEAVFPDRVGLYVSTSGIMPEGGAQGASQSASGIMISAGVYRQTTGFPIPRVYLPYAGKK